MKYLVRMHQRLSAPLGQSLTDYALAFSAIAFLVYLFYQALDGVVGNLLNWMSAL